MGCWRSDDGVWHKAEKRSCSPGSCKICSTGADFIDKVEVVLSKSEGVIMFIEPDSTGAVFRGALTGQGVPKAIGLATN